MFSVCVTPSSVAHSAGDSFGVLRGFGQRTSFRKAYADVELRLIIPGKHVFADHHEQRNDDEHDQRCSSKQSFSGAPWPKPALWYRWYPECGKIVHLWICAPLFSVGGWTKREHNMGVRVKDTSIETTTAPAQVNPKALMKRPAIPPMNPTGMKTASRDTVVASTASPISLVPRSAASKAPSFSLPCTDRYSPAQ